MLTEVPRTDADGDLLDVGNPVKLSRVAEGPVGPFPSLGEDTDPVLGVGGGLIDRRHDGAGARLGSLAGVDGQRVEAQSHSATLVRVRSAP